MSKKSLPRAFGSGMVSQAPFPTIASKISAKPDTGSLSVESIEGKVIVDEVPHFVESDQDKGIIVTTDEHGITTEFERKVAQKIQETNELYAVLMVTTADEFLAALTNEAAKEIHLGATIDLSNETNQNIDVTRHDLVINGHGHMIKVPSALSKGVGLVLSGNGIVFENIWLDIVKTEGDSIANGITVTGNDVILRHLTINHSERAGICVYQANRAMLHDISVVGQKTAQFVNQVGLLLHSSSVSISDIAISTNATGISVRHVRNSTDFKCELNVTGKLSIVGSVIQAKAETAKGISVTCDANQLVPTSTLSGMTIYKAPETGDSKPSTDEGVRNHLTGEKVGFAEFKVSKESAHPSIGAKNSKDFGITIKDVQVSHNTENQVKVKFAFDQPLNLSYVSEDNIVISAMNLTTGHVLKVKNKTWSEYLYDESGFGYGGGSRLAVGSYLTVFSQEQLQNTPPADVMIKISVSYKGRVYEALGIVSVSDYKDLAPSKQIRTVTKTFVNDVATVSETFECHKTNLLRIVGKKPDMLASVVHRLKVKTCGYVESVYSRDNLAIQGIYFYVDT
ncbi:MAG: pectate lyase-like adhesive domain-containing protein [Turicibacter sp.]